MPNISENNTSSFVFKHFDDLTVHELYAMLQLREAVFQIDQNCLYVDIDDKDQHCYHLMYWQDNILLAYARIVPKGISYDDAISFGRVCTALTNRNKGIGYILMDEVMKQIQQIYPNEPIKISAQTYLVSFYIKYGFKTIGQAYLEDLLPHIAMENNHIC